MADTAPAKIKLQSNDQHLIEVGTYRRSPMASALHPKIFAIAYMTCLVSVQISRSLSAPS